MTTDVKSIMNRISVLALITLLIVGCNRSHRPGEVEMIDHGTVYHLADGFLVQERRDGGTHFYLIESTKADYMLTEEGLSFEEKGGGVTREVFHRSPEGYVAARFADLNGDGPESTRFQIDDEKFSDFLQKVTSATTVQDIHNHKR